MRLDQGWQFRQAGEQKWYPAQVPGEVHTDLLRQGLIADPFYRDNESKLQWIGKTDWEYQTRFTVAAGLRQRENVELVFAGLDTYADVFLNDSLILRADNMFREWRVACKSLLRAGENTLRVPFRSPINEVLPRMAQLTYQLPAVNDHGEKTSPKAPLCDTFAAWRLCVKCFVSCTKGNDPLETWQMLSSRRTPVKTQPQRPAISLSPHEPKPKKNLHAKMQSRKKPAKLFFAKPFRLGAFA